MQPDSITEMSENHAWPRESSRESILQWKQRLLYAVKNIENIGAASPMFARIYSKLFYKKMVTREIALSEITPGMRVLHVGCGPFPMTAMMLARFGARVTAADIDPNALILARRVLERNGLSSGIRLVSGCGSSLDFSGYQAVWISLHVQPMQKVIIRALDNTPPEAAVVFRGPAGVLKHFYDETDAFRIGAAVHRREVSQPFGKKSILLKKG